MSPQSTIAILGGLGKNTIWFLITRIFWISRRDYTRIMMKQASFRKSADGSMRIHTPLSISIARRYMSTFRKHLSSSSSFTVTTMKSACSIPPHLMMVGMNMRFPGTISSKDLRFGKPIRQNKKGQWQSVKIHIPLCSWNPNSMWNPRSSSAVYIMIWRQC